MTMTVKKGLESGSYGPDGWKFTVEYFVDGATSAYEALTAPGLPAARSLYDGGQGSGVWLTARASSFEASLGSDDGLIWKVTVQYTPNTGGGGGGQGKPDNPEPGDEYWEFDGRGERVHVDTCLGGPSEGSAGGNVQAAYPEDAPDIGLAVGVDENGDVKGAEINEPSLILTVHLYVDPDALTPIYLNAIQADITKVNSVEFYGFAPGMVYFDSWKTANQREDLAEIVFQFLIKANLAAEDMPEFLDRNGDPIEITSGKLGWEYLHATPATRKDDTGSDGAPRTVKYFKGVYVCEFYKLSDFSALGLSGSLT